jgi:putative nucleotidyltransferase-like protein
MAQASSAEMTPIQELILLSAATRERRQAQRERIDSLVGTVEWEALSDQLVHGRLLPTLGPRIAELAGAEAPAEFREAASAAVEACRRQDALLLLIGQQVTEALRARGIAAAALKGPGLGAELHGEAGRRLSSDIDLLVPAARLREAVEVAAELGYEQPTDPVEQNGLPLLHFAMPHGELPAVELHWRIHWYEERFAEERLLPPAGAAGDWRPEPVDRLVALLLYYARDGFTGMRQATDLAAWWDRAGDGLGGGELEARLDAYPQLRPAVSAAARVADRMVGLPSARLLNGAGLGGRGRVAVALADPRPYATMQQLYAEIALIDGLLTPRGGFGAYLRRQVAPPTEVIEDHTAKGLGAHMTSRAGYALRILGRYALALGRLLRIPGTAAPRFETG